MTRSSAAEPASACRGIRAMATATARATAAEARNTWCSAGSSAAAGTPLAVPSLPAIEGASEALATAPKTAMPTALPIDRANMTVPGHDPAGRPVHRRLGGHEGRAGDHAHAQPDHEAGDGDLGHRALAGQGQQQSGPGQQQDHPQQGGGAEPDPQVDLAGQRGGQRPAESEGGQGEAGHQGPGAEHVLHEQRHVRGQADE